MRTNKQKFKIHPPSPFFFWGGSVRVPNFETGINHCVPCDVILFYHSKRCGKLITCGPRASSWKIYSDFRCIFFERCTAIFGASFAGLFWALQDPWGFASIWKEIHGSTQQIYTTLDHILAHLLVSPWPTKNMQFYRVDQTVLHIDKSLLGCCGQFRRPLWRIFYIFTGGTTCKATNLTICARWKSSHRLHVCLARVLACPSCLRVPCTSLRVRCLRCVFTRLLLLVDTTCLWERVVLVRVPRARRPYTCLRVSFLCQRMCFVCTWSRYPITRACPLHNHWEGTHPINHGRMVVTPTIGVWQRRLCLTSFSLSPPPYTTKTWHLSFHPHNTRVYHQPRPHTRPGGMSAKFVKLCSQNIALEVITSDHE